MTKEQILQTINMLGQAALVELRAADVSTPEGAQAAFGDGTLLKLFMELLPLLLALLKNFM